MPVSPPTRGWTRDGVVFVVETEGFPAHAGMDPPPPARPHRLVRFPRPRGDGPTWYWARIGSCAVSPPTRGWTPTRPTRRFVLRGFPAHAGMDLRQATGGQYMPWFPRPRGDGPRSGSSVWRLVAGFPAHAGMDPPLTTAALASGRFPRPRGDGPRHGLHRVCSYRVSPAHAGMDLKLTSEFDPSTRFPRPRGDGPTILVAIDLFEEVSPPTRGWTRSPAAQFQRPSGFPAHAGMDPFGDVECFWYDRFPRPRGDGTRL